MSVYTEPVRPHLSPPSLALEETADLLYGEIGHERLETQGQQWSKGGGGGAAQN